MNRRPSKACRRPDKQSVRIALNIDAMIGGQTHSPLGQPTRGGWIGVVLDLEHTLRQRLGRVACQHRHAALGDDGAVVEHRSYKMYSATVNADPRRQSLGMGVQTRKSWQQRRVDINQLASVMIDEAGRQHAHKARQQHIIRFEAVDLGGQRRVKSFAAGKFLVKQGRRRNTPFSGPLEAGSVGTAGDDCRHFGRPDLIRATLHQRLHIAAPP